MSRSRGSHEGTHTVVEELDHTGQRYLVIGFDAPRYSCLFPLSPSELQVVQAFIEGLSMRAIAEERGVAPRTVENQITRAYRKLGVKSRSELLTLVLQGATHRPAAKNYSSTVHK